MLYHYLRWEQTENYINGRICDVTDGSVKNRKTEALFEIVKNKLFQKIEKDTLEKQVNNFQEQFIQKTKKVIYSKIVEHGLIEKKKDCAWK